MEQLFPELAVSVGCFLALASVVLEACGGCWYFEVVVMG